LTERSCTTHQSLLPGPASRVAGDFVFVSSIHPVDQDGLLVRSSSPSPYVGESEVAAQTRSVLDSLEQTLEAGGSGLDRVLRLEVQLADAADFAEFKHVWRNAFPVDPPARTTIVVGDEHIVPGARLNLHGVAIAGSSSVERVLVQDAPGAPSPGDAEHAALAAIGGPFVFASAFPATDFRTGLAAGRAPGFPYFGSDAGLQARFVIDNLARVLAAAGSSLDLGLKVQFYETDLLNFHEVDPVWGDAVGTTPPTRSSMACRGFVVPGALFAANLMALVPGRGLEKQETRAGIRWHPIDAGKANFSPGILAGDWLFTAGQVPLPDITKHEWEGAPAGLPHHWDDIETETEYTLELLREQLTANGFAFDDVVDARVYLVDPRRDFRGFARVWERAFPDEARRPALTLIPSRQADGRPGVMIEGPMIEIDLTSKRNA
jgi:enamine deaminase RidA (YjgF/YER057c/UK114 family)